jgi:glutathione S-transferase
MITLYGGASAASTVIHWLLIELGLPHELKLFDIDRREHRTPEYLKLNPAGTVPTLVLGGLVLTETAAIAMHLGDLHPERALAPAVGTAERAIYYQWMFFMANTVQPAYRAWFYPNEPAGAENADATKRQARLHLEDAWARVAAHLEAQREANAGPYMLGARLTAVDFLTTILMRWARKMPRPVETWPALAAYARRMKSLPSFREVYAREGLTDWT